MSGRVPWVGKEPRGSVFSISPALLKTVGDLGVGASSWRGTASAWCFILVIPCTQFKKVPTCLKIMGPSKS